MSISSCSFFISLLLLYFLFPSGHHWCNTKCPVLTRSSSHHSNCSLICFTSIYTFIVIMMMMIVLLRFTVLYLFCCCCCCCCTFLSFFFFLFLVFLCFVQWVLKEFRFCMDDGGHTGNSREHKRRAKRKEKNTWLPRETLLCIYFSIIIVILIL